MATPLTGILIAVLLIACIVVGANLALPTLHRASEQIAELRREHEEVMRLMRILVRGYYVPERPPPVFGFVRVLLMPGRCLERMRDYRRYLQTIAGERVP